MPTELREEIDVTMGDAMELLIDIFRPKLVPFLVSSPGVGKSALYQQLANKYDLKLVDVRLSMSDPADLNGFPFIMTELNIDKRLVKAGYVPMETFPIDSDPLPYKYKTVTQEDGSIVYEKTGEQYKGWLILLDEFNAAPPTVQAAAYKIVLDRMVGMHKLHPRALVGAAGNKKSDKAIVNRVGTAMQSRLVWLLIRTDPEAWGLWAEKNNIDHRVRSFIQFQPDLLHNFDPNHQEFTFPCPRTWEFMSRIIKYWKTIPIKKLPVIAGTVGEGAARQFWPYCQIFEEIPTIEEIKADPEGCRFGSEPSMHYALMGLVSHNLTGATADILIPFLKRLDIDFQVIALQMAIRGDRTIKKTKAYRKWIALNADELMP